MFFKSLTKPVSGLFLIGFFFFNLSVKAEDLRDRLLPRTFISAQKLIPFPLDLELGENCTKKRQIDRVFSLREQLEFIEEFSPGQIDELIQYSEFVTRELLLEVNKQDLSGLDAALIEVGVGGAQVNAKKALWSAFQARASMFSALEHSVTTVVTKALSGLSTNSISCDLYPQNCTWWIAARRIYTSVVSGFWLRSNVRSVREEFTDASSEDALAILQGVLKNLPEKNPDLLARKAYEISKLIHLAWLVRTGPRYYEVFFHTAYRFPVITESWDIQKTHLESEMSKEAVKDNPFVIELRYFLERAEEKLPLN